MKRTIDIKIPARLHMSVWDMNCFGLGKYGGGGIGLAIKEYTEITISESSEKANVGEDEKLIKQVISELKKLFNISSCYSVCVKQKQAAHIGMGSTGSLVLGIIYGFTRLNGIFLTDKELVDIFQKNIKEEHSKEITECFETLVGTWAALRGGVVVLDKSSKLLMECKNLPRYNVLLVLPQEKVLLKNELTDEIKLLEGKAKKEDFVEREQKERLIRQLITYEGKELLEKINELKYLGSKKEEINYQCEKNQLYKHLIYLGEHNNIVCAGMSSIGPLYYYIDVKEKLENVEDALKRLGKFNTILTGIHNETISEGEYYYK